MAAPEKLVPIAGTTLEHRDGSRVVGKVDPKERAEVTVRLRPTPKGPGVAGLEQLAMELGAQLPGDRKYLSQDDYRIRFGADAGDVAALVAYAQGQGIDVVETSLDARTVVLSAPLGTLAPAFGVTLELSKIDNEVYRERTGPILVPPELADVVLGIFGFDTRRFAESQRRTRAGSGPDGYTPLQVAALYDFPQGLDGTGQTIGILEFGGGFGTSDLNTYFGGLGIKVPDVVAVPVGGAKNDPGTDPDVDGEVLLDIEVAGAVAPGAKIAVYFSDFTVKGWVDALTRAIHDATNNPSVISISWGFAENEPLGQGVAAIWTQAAVNTVNQALAAAATLGVTVICASGDDGSSDQFDDGRDHVDFPASSPYMLACGGTKLEGQGTTITGEVVWNELASQEGATGGGISQLNPRPTYQSNLRVPSAAKSGGVAGRALPDVAGDADPTTGFTTLVDGQTQVTGGTSAVAPLWAGLIALINQGIGARVGFFNPLLYSTIGPDGVLRDITQGNNGDFQAGPGWDACTGWGSPDGQKLLDALKGSTAGGSTGGSAASPAVGSSNGSSADGPDGGSSDGSDDGSDD